MAVKKFRFSLEQVLTVRRHEAERAEQRLAKALQARRDREARLDDAERALRTVLEEAPAPGAVTPAAFRRHAATQHEAMRLRKQASHALDVARMKEREAYRALLDARRPQEALHTLRDQQQQAHRQAALRAEAEFLDDQATAAYCRQLRAHG